MPSARRQRL
uniref:Uncharacterized protein n=1 Tax=Arundo donax TaxID=35708 RepID=A0A0A9BGV4_ARUDO